MEFRSYQVSVRTTDRGPAGAAGSSLQPAQANGRLQIPRVPTRLCSQTPTATVAGSKLSYQLQNRLTASPAI